MDMIHVRLVIPPDLADETVAVLSADRCVFNLVSLPDAARHPDGTAVQCDILAGAANETLGRLRGLAVEQRGSIVVEPVDMALSGPAAEVEKQTLGARARAPIWEEVEARIHAEGTYRPSFYLYLAIAGIIGSVGIITNSQILIVAAMIVGPEYGAITSISLGLANHNSVRIRQGLLALLLGFTLAVVATFLFSLLVRGLGLQPTAFTLGIRPVSNLINTPNFFSFVVAVLAGVVGIVSLTQARTSALLGVFISVTTIPAAADIGVSCAFSSFTEARGSLLQLLLNIAVLIVVGLATLTAQPAIWRRISRRRSRAHER
ncbi:DUF389 domain-containing protein [Streptomyces sp. NPDC005181]|uniref:DUF389 domain-containing protein n=1 Tax=Streptomyces sp. NPDC005181 TaxID=3156869 RepID=UPI0033B9C177